MRIAVLDLTTHPEPLLTGLPTAAAQIERWLSPALPEATFLPVSVATAGEALPDLGAFDGVVVSGSEYGVYDDAPWMEPLRVFLRAVRGARKPVYGICFGHQIMADTYGGKAGKADCGYVVGARSFDVAGEAIETHVWHQDQVSVAPPGARVSGTAEYCPIGALDYHFPARSVQFHPEFREEQMRSLFERGRDTLIDGDIADDAVASFEGARVATDLQAAETAAFFREHVNVD